MCCVCVFLCESLKVLLVFSELLCVSLCVCVVFCCFQWFLMFLCVRVCFCVFVFVFVCLCVFSVYFVCVFFCVCFFCVCFCVCERVCVCLCVVCVFYMCGCVWGGVLFLADSITFFCTPRSLLAVCGHTLVTDMPAERATQCSLTISTSTGILVVAIISNG